MIRISYPTAFCLAFLVYLATHSMVAVMIVVFLFTLFVPYLLVAAGDASKRAADEAATKRLREQRLILDADIQHVTTDDVTKVHGRYPPALRPGAEIITPKTPWMVS